MEERINLNNSDFKVKITTVRNSKKATPDGFNGYGKQRSNQFIKYGSFSKYDKQIGVYWIKNNKTNFIYIGSSKNIQLRLLKHISLLRNNNHPNAKLQNDYNEYGYDSFEFGVYETMKENEFNKKELLNKEIEYQKHYSPKILYNLVITGVLSSDAQKEAWKNIDKSSYRTKEYRNKMRSLKINRIGKFDELSGKLLETFESSDDVCAKYKIAKSTLLGCCNGSKKRALGYVWRYLDKNNNIMLQGRGRKRDIIIQNEDIV